LDERTDGSVLESLIVESPALEKGDERPKRFIGVHKRGCDREESEGMASGRIVRSGSLRKRESEEGERVGNPSSFP